MAMTLELTNDYGLVLVAAGVIGMTNLFIGGSVMGARSKAFKSKAFLEKKAVKDMQEEHKKAFGEGIHELGYPDMGCGLYAQQLDYADWVTFNNAQRAHYNMVESMAPVLATLIVAGLSAPKLSGCLGLGYAFGRILYKIGYTSKKGANGRAAGAMVAALCSLGLFGTAIVQGVRVFLS
jgi:hypothetical protein